MKSAFRASARAAGSKGWGGRAGWNRPWSRKPRNRGAWRLETAEAAEEGSVGGEAHEGAASGGGAGQCWHCPDVDSSIR